MRFYKVFWLTFACLLAGYIIVAVMQMGPPFSTPKPAQAQPQTTTWIETPSGVKYTDSVDGQVRCYRYGWEAPFQCLPLEKTP